MACQILAVLMTFKVIGLFANLFAMFIFSAAVDMISVAMAHIHIPSVILMMQRRAVTD